MKIFLLYLFVILGEAAHVLMRAWLSSRSSLTPWNTVRDYIAAHWPPIVVRWFLALCFFAAWVESPKFLDQFLGRFGVSIGFDLPLNKATAGMFGYLADSILDVAATAIPALRGVLPGYEAKETQSQSANAGK